MTYEQMLQDIAYQKHLAVCAEDRAAFEAGSLQQKYLLLTTAIKYIQRLGFDLPAVIRVWNDCKEGKGD